MSEKEYAELLLNKVPTYKMKYVITYLQGLTADEYDDDEYCEKLYQEYLNDTDETKDDVFSLEDCKKEWGID